MLLKETKEVAEEFVSVSASCQLQRSRSTVPARKANFTVGGGRFTLTHRLGFGAFGDIYQAIDTQNDTKVAVKLEKRKVACQQLSYESKVYGVLLHGTVGPVGIPRIYYYDSDGEYNVLVMDLCGPSLEDLFNYCGRQFSIKTVCMLAHQMIDRIEFIHGKGFLHRDIKPENFVFGLTSKGHILHIVDFGLSKLYWDKQKRAHIPFCEGKSLTGTARYCSTWTHRGNEQGRRDDMESIGFILVYFLTGSLPWQGILVHDQQLRTTKIGERKMRMALRDLCQGLPVEIFEYCTYCRALKFTARPDYSYLRGLFLRLARRLNLVKQPPTEAVVDKPPRPAHEEELMGLSHKTILTDSPNDDDVGGGAGGGDAYDWMFDWFLKRTREVEEGRQRAQLTPGDAAPSQSGSPLAAMGNSGSRQTH